MLVEHSVGPNTSNPWTPPLAIQSRNVATKPKPLWWWGGWALWIVFITSLCIYIYIKYFSYLLCYPVLPAALQQRVRISSNFHWSWGILGNWHRFFILFSWSFSTVHQVFFSLYVFFPAWGIQFMAVHAGWLSGRRRMWPVKLNMPVCHHVT